MKILFGKHRFFSTLLICLFLIPLAPNMERWLDLYDKGEISRNHIMYFVRTHDRTTEIVIRSLEYKNSYNCNRGYFLGWTW